MIPVDGMRRALREVYRGVVGIEGQAGEDTGPYGGLRKATKKHHHQARRPLPYWVSETNSQKI